MAELSDTDIYGELSLYGDLAFSGLVPYTGATTGEFTYALPSNPAGFFPITLDVFSSGISGDHLGTSGYMVPFYAPITGN